MSRSPLPRAQRLVGRPSPEHLGVASAAAARPHIPPSHAANPAGGIDPRPSTRTRSDTAPRPASPCLIPNTATYSISARIGPNARTHRAYEACHAYDDADRAGALDVADALLANAVPIACVALGAPRPWEVGVVWELPVTLLASHPPRASASSSPWPSRDAVGDTHTPTYLPLSAEVGAGTPWTPHGGRDGGTPLACGRHAPTPYAFDTHAIVTSVVVVAALVFGTNESGVGATALETASAGCLSWLGRPDASAGRLPPDDDVVGSTGGRWPAFVLRGVLTMAGRIDATAGGPSVAPALLPPRPSLHLPPAVPAAPTAPPLLITTAILNSASSRRAAPLVVDGNRRLARR